MEQTAASVAAATWASQGSRPVLAMTAASLTPCSASRRGAISVLWSLPGRAGRRRPPQSAHLAPRRPWPAHMEDERLPRASSSRVRPVTSGRAPRLSTAGRRQLTVRQLHRPADFRRIRRRHLCGRLASRGQRHPRPRCAGSRQHAGCSCQPDVIPMSGTSRPENRSQGLTCARNVISRA